MGLIFVFSILLRVSLAYLLFLLLSSTLNLIIIRYRLVATSIWVGVIMGILDLFSLPIVYELIIYYALFSSALVVIHNPTNFKKFLLLETVMMAYILLGWGVAYLAQIIFFNIFKFSIISYYVYICVESFVILLFGVIVYCVFRVCYKKKLVLDFVFDISLLLGNQKAKFKMLLDSGNSLYDDNLTGLPILIVSKFSLEKKLNKKIDLSKFRRVNYVTLNGFSASLPVVAPDKIYMNMNGQRKCIQALIGIVEKDFVLYDGLLHASVI